MEYKFLNDSIVYSQDKEGNWIYKAATSVPFKKNGNLKKVYRDEPRYPVIVQYESKELKDYQQSLSEAIKDISIKLVSFNR
jgi:hypothetical protein